MKHKVFSGIHRSYFKKKSSVIDVRSNTCGSAFLSMFFRITKFLSIIFQITYLKLKIIINEKRVKYALYFDASSALCL